MKLKEIREMYPEGTQIVITEMAGESQMPYGLKGTVKFVDDAGQIHMRWENGSSLALNINDDTFEKVEAPEKISVILVEPGRYPKLIEIEDTLEAMQSLVEGDIEEYMPFEDEVAIICNEEGKMNGMPLNRAVYSEPENVEMSYPQLKAHFRQAEKERNHTTGYIVFTADSFDKPYTEEQRTYVVSSNNKAFIEGSVIIPVQAQYLPAKGMTQLMQTIGKVRQYINPSLRIDGILLNIVDNRTNLAKSTADALRKNFGSVIKIYRSSIPMAVKAAEVASKGVSIYKYEPSSPVAKAYAEFAKEVSADGRKKERLHSADAR